MISRKLHFIYHWEVITSSGQRIEQPLKGYPSDYKDIAIIRLVPHSLEFPQIDYNIPLNSKPIYFKRNILECKLRGNTIPVGLTYNIGYIEDKKKYFKSFDVLTKEIKEVIENV